MKIKPQLSDFKIEGLILWVNENRETKIVIKPVFLFLFL